MIPCTSRLCYRARDYHRMQTDSELDCFSNTIIPDAGTYLHTEVFRNYTLVYISVVYAYTMFKYMRSCITLSCTPNVEVIGRVLGVRRHVRIEYAYFHRRYLIPLKHFISVTVVTCSDNNDRSWGKRPCVLGGGGGALTLTDTWV